MIDVYGLDETAGRWRQAALTVAAGCSLATPPRSTPRLAFPAKGWLHLHAAASMDSVSTAHSGPRPGTGDFAAVVDELARQCASTAMVYVMHVTAAKVIEGARTFAKRARYRGRRSPRASTDHHSLLRAGFALAILGPGLSAGGAWARLSDACGQILGDGGASCGLLCGQCPGPWRPISLSRRFLGAAATGGRAAYERLQRARAAGMTRRQSRSEALDVAQRRAAHAHRRA
jgi:hypothetical protein